MSCLVSDRSAHQWLFCELFFIEDHDRNASDWDFPRVPDMCHTYFEKASEMENQSTRSEEERLRLF